MCIFICVTFLGSVFAEKITFRCTAGVLKVVETEDNI